MVIDQYGIYIANLNPRIGTKPGKIRPVVAIQGNTLNKTEHPSVIVLPLSSQTSQRDAYPLRIFLSQSDSGLSKDSVILVDQILSWDITRITKKVGLLPKNKQNELIEALKDIFDWE
ncbi:type II toxin-antitoxin system PemK/MazF family toxin [bacterium]|nr:type II toxin-antitoxin system PemK/MazF family toxin [bacterium]